MKKNWAPQFKLAGGDVWLGRGMKLIGLGAVLMLLGTALVISRVPPQIPLHYARPWGELQLVARNRLWPLAGLVVVIGLVNSWLSVAFFEKFRLLSRIIVWSTVLLVFLVLLSLATVWIRVGL